MHKALPIREGVYWVGVNDRTTDLFEGIWPLPRGVSYNAYAIVDKKVALVDTVKGLAADEYFAVSGRQMTVEYVLLAEINDRSEHAHQLAGLLRGREGGLGHVHVGFHT